MVLDTYKTGDYYDEVFLADGNPRLRSAGFVKRLTGLSEGELQHRQKAADTALYNMGITFAVYGNAEGTEKVWPFDIIPRIIEASEWKMIEEGLKQRVRALNLFIDDIYQDRRILKDKIIPESLVITASSLRGPCVGIRPPKGIWCHITGVDLVRDRDGQFYVLEDNLRCPSGVSYVLENREVMKRTFANVFQGMSVRPVEDYPERLLETLLSCAPDGVSNPTAVVLTPGIFNSAYFEHSFLAHQMGVELVQGPDLTVVDGFVYMRTTQGLKRVDVIYRRIDDDFLDPKCFRPESCLGVSHLMDAYRAGRVTLANAPGTGIADDKAIYAYVPRIIKYYLDQDPILPNVPTYLCDEEKEREYVLSHLDELVVKPTNESGGYGILMGPRASDAERQKCAESIHRNPRNYIAQPMLGLSTVPTIVGDELQARHVDLRPFVLCGPKGITVMPGGLTRVALREGSMIVNSSQGGGSKDTWVLREAPTACNLEGGCGMLSRVADSVSWMARYVERAENVARFIDVNHNLEIDQGDTVREQWAPLVYTTGDEEPFRERYDSMTRENVIRFLAFDRENPNSILSCVRAARGKRSDHSGGYFVLHVGRTQQVLPHGASGGRAAGRAGAALRLLPSRQDGEPPARGCNGLHHVALRSLALRPHGTSPGAGGQNLTHRRREVLHPAAECGTGRFVRRHRSMVGLAQVSQRPGDVPPSLRPALCPSGWQTTWFSIGISLARCTSASSRPPSRSRPSREASPAPIGSPPSSVSGCSVRKWTTRASTPSSNRGSTNTWMTSKPGSTGSARRFSRTSSP